MDVHNLSERNSLLNNFLKEIRSVEIQKDSMRFRRNLERIAEILSYELSKGLNYFSEDVQTPFSKVQINTVSDQLVVASILRAGIPFHQGVLNYFDKAENAFVSAFRNYNDATHTTFDISVEYIASPDLNGKTLRSNVSNRRFDGIVLQSSFVQGNTSKSTYFEFDCKSASN